MSYRVNRGMRGLTDSPTTWDKTDWALAGLIGFALVASWSAFKSAFRRLK